MLLKGKIIDNKLMMDSTCVADATNFVKSYDGQEIEYELRPAAPQQERDTRIKYINYFRGEVRSRITLKLREEGWLIDTEEQCELVCITVYAKLGIATKKIHHKNPSHTPLEILYVIDYMDAEELYRFIDYITQWSKAMYGIQFKPFKEYYSV